MSFSGALKAGKTASGKASFTFDRPMSGFFAAEEIV
jgi:hypothetical protein